MSHDKNGAAAAVVSDDEFQDAIDDYTPQSKLSLVLHSILDLTLTIWLSSNSFVTSHHISSS